MAKINVQGRRMVQEDKIAKIGEGAEYTAGTGITITGSTISVDTETVAMKSGLAAVATTGAYSDLTGTPTIPVVSANTGATPSATLTDLNVDGTVYSVGGGSGVTFTDFINLGDNVPSEGDPITTLTSEQYNQVLTGQKGIKYRGWLFLVTEDDTGGNQLILNCCTLNGLHSANYGYNQPALFLDKSTYEIYLGDYGFIEVNSSDTPSQTLTNIKIGGNTFGVSGGGSSYTFTNGLTETSGTVSWNLNDKIKDAQSSGYDYIRMIAPNNLYNTTYLKTGFNGELFINHTYQSATNAIVIKSAETYNAPSIYSNNSNTCDLGRADKLFKNLYLAGNISDGTNSVSVSDLIALITYAKTQGWIQ